MRISDNDGDVHQSVEYQGEGALEAHLGPHDQLIRCLGLAGDVLQPVGHQGGGAQQAINMCIMQNEQLHHLHDG